MKKYILSFLIIGTFGSYVLFERSTNASEVLALNPEKPTESLENLNNNSSSSPATDDSPKKVPATKSTQPSAPVNTPIKNPPPVTSPVVATTSSGKYKDGSYIGLSENAYYGYIQVEAVVSGGKLADVKILDYPNDRGTSIRINSIALPILVSEAIQAQSANINSVSGASDSSGAFKLSLGSALKKAGNA